MEEIRKQLQCKSCLEPMFPPILTCQKGESVCENCRINHDKCPLCNKRFTNKPNEALEVLAKIPCFNCPKCNVPLQLVELKEHFASCLQTDSLIKCPIEKCTWKGGIDQLGDHWRSKKLALNPYVEENICRTKLSKYSYFSNMIEAHQSIFFFKSMCNEGKFFWAVQYVGNPGDAEKFSYEIEIFNPNRLECKFILSSFCQRIDLSNQALFKDGVCIFTPKELLEPYLLNNELLLYNLKVRKVNEEEVKNYRKKVDKALEKYKVKK